ncbi:MULTISPECIES: xanthine dehydrogenase accessory protein XdhC [unclassified Cobetia]|uniref:xanthine dehydrogenase accessory protein XdhC n=1 Tax=unclassified Cobetia TaxID=2609414 RepID=UPI002097AFF8|nr:MULTISPECIES: xanthine dehydrogenase accessory protein XdhC [unclassified Cobetia]MCO7233741.1 xanthine dehydrogenase accessory protein XdhC [Cobetia sp. Dlab-2-AX]MCO7237086.1 xanthine dehydrogenase accessory protein XdhC [Cobetia sp. Dlab-2-U]
MNAKSAATGRWYQALAEAQAALTAHALATVVTVAGSAPRGAGSKMLITPDTLHDSLGGGRLEQLVVERARERLAQGQSGCLLEEIALGQHAQQCCGGHVQVLIELYPALAPRLALFGAGHVGQAIVHLLAPLGWQIDWHDSRAEQLAAAAVPPGCEGRVQRQIFNILSEPSLASATPAKESLSTLLPGMTNCHVLILTHDHIEDQALVAALATREDLASLGLIGSDSKWARFRQRLRGDLDEHEIARVRCPIGVPGIPGKRPEEIAIGVVAELLQIEARRNDEAALSSHDRASGHGTSIQGTSLDGHGLTRREARQLRARFSPDATHQTAPTQKAE